MPTLRTFLILLLLTGLVSSSGCRTSRNCDSDGNGDAVNAMLLSDLVNIKDKVGGRCDNVDWRYISHHAPASVNLTLHVGDAFKGHRLNGFIGVYDADANIIVQKDIRPGQNKYELSVNVDSKISYYVRIESTSGASSYELNTVFSERDPCAACPAGTRCSNERCVTIPRSPCGEPCPQGYDCDFGSRRCLPMPCGGPCGPGSYCDEDSDRCVADDDGCRRNSDCPRGERCKRGQCIPKPAAAPPCGSDSDCSKNKTCKRGKCVRKPQCQTSGDCTGGKECKSGKCVRAKEETVESSGPVSGSIVSVQSGAKGTILTISVPTSHGIKKGASGKVKGLPSGNFVITKVAGSRVQARMTKIKSRDGVGGHRSVVIYP